ncbi:MAG: glycine zipper 2TM domain-containing protein [Robiginitomaculum sp.]|nr:glycine zipper 2TM domain-containing protein [Robiginitomaculum sp.]
MLKRNSLRRAVGAASLSTALLLGACASELGANDYSRGSIGQISRSDSGIVVSSRAIRIEGTQSGVGTVGGAAVGGIAGAELGGDDAGRLVGGILGAIVGGLVGSAIEKNTTEREGFAYTIQLDRDGDHITITQGGGDYPIANGTPVWVEYGERARVIPKGVQAGY